MSSTDSDERRDGEHGDGVRPPPLEPAPGEAELLYKWRLLWAQRDRPRPERPDLQAFVDGAENPVIRLMKQVPPERGT